MSYNDDGLGKVEPEVLVFNGQTQEEANLLSAKKDHSVVKPCNYQSLMVDDTQPDLRKMKEKVELYTFGETIDKTKDLLALAGVQAKAAEAENLKSAENKKLLYENELGDCEIDLNRKSGKNRISAYPLWRQLAGFKTNYISNEVLEAFLKVIQSKTSIKLSLSDDQVLLINGIKTKYDGCKISKAIEGLENLMDKEQAMSVAADVIIKHINSLFV